MITRILQFFKIKTPPDLMLEEKREVFKRRFLSFQKLLGANNWVLKSMADMSEKLSGEHPFDSDYIAANLSSISAGMATIITAMDELSPGKYSALHERFSSISEEISSIIYCKKDIQSQRYIVPLNELGSESTDFAGGKAANLGEVKNRIRLSTPEGFSVTAHAYHRLIEYNGLSDAIKNILGAALLTDTEQCMAASSSIQGLIMNADIPDDLEKQIHDAVQSLMPENNDASLRLAVRSSTIQEDGESTFAGQYQTCLNVRPEDVIQKYKEVVASLFSSEALFYFKTKGFQDKDMMMPVCIIKMVRARAAGVIYTVDPNNPAKKHILINSVRGLGKCVVDGTITPEIYTVSRDSMIVDRSVPLQQVMLVCSLNGEVEESPVSDTVMGQSSVSDEEVIRLAETALVIENHYKAPQDIEWAIDGEGNVIVLQTRPLWIFSKPLSDSIPDKIHDRNILISTGIIACKGVGFGKVHIVGTDDDLKGFVEGSVLVSRKPTTKFVMLMNKASAIITDLGGSTGHMASLAREFQIPTILDTENGTKLLRQGQEITVDAFNCYVYEGKVDELLNVSWGKINPFIGTHIYQMLMKVSKLIIPLNLVDPSREDFKAERCLTFHDITRFCHEMSMQELFNFSDAKLGDIGGVRLETTIPMEIYILDLGEGISNYRGKLKPQHLVSAPLIYFLKGLSEMRWPVKKKAQDKKTPTWSVARDNVPSDHEAPVADETNFCIITKDYMNFGVRLGYHLSTIEAYAGYVLNSNYVKIFFKGGGARKDRRLRRVRLISEILKSLDFSVSITDDVINAVLMKCRKTHIENVLIVLGKLAVYTKQLDMVMFNEAITDWYIEDFINKHISEDITHGKVHVVSS